MRIGIAGMPNAGKSTLFNALTLAGAETGEYPFTTIEPNVAVVSVPDDRLPRVAEAVGASGVVNEAISFADIAGLVRGASGGEGLGNRFLAEIREADAICHVVRCHRAPGVPHPEGDVDPVRDAELVEAELLAADLEQAEGRLERVTKQARSGEKGAIAEREWLEAVIEALKAGRAVREVHGPGGRGRRSGAPPGADLEADPLRRQRRRGQRGGTAGARRVRQGFGRRGGRDQCQGRSGACGALGRG